MESEVELQGAEAEGSDPNAVSPLELVAFLTHAVKRHLPMSIAIGFGVALIGVAVAFVIPPRFDAEVRILFNSNASVAPALSSPLQQRGASLDPFSGATELLMQKSNLISIVEQANLLQHFRTNRTWPQRTKDSIFALIAPKLSDERMKVSLAETLENRMFSFHSDKLLTIHVGWSDPDMTVKLAELAQKSYLDMRRTDELAVITAAITINEDEVKRAAEGIDQALSDVVRVREQIQTAALSAAQPTGTAKGRRGAVPSRSSAGGTPAAASSATPDKRITAQLAEVRQDAQALEVPWQRRQAELKFQLNDLRGTFGPEHPTVLQQESKIRESAIVPPELARLREEERRLLAQLEAATAIESSAAIAGQGTGQGPAVAQTTVAGKAALPAATSARLLASSATLVIAERDDDPMLAPARANLASAIQRYNEVTRRLDAARLELTSAQVALQYRYAVVGQPERPIRPSKPNRPLLVLGALLAGALLGFLSGAIRDLLSGKVFEPWQVKSTGLPLLGVVHLGSKPKA